MTRSDLTGADLIFADAAGAILSGTEFEGAECMGFATENPILANANFKGAKNFYPRIGAFFHNTILDDGDVICGLDWLE
ncbi:MAG: hypothetical protein F6K23_03285 [Okeania sp. SIO2C9]|uniref:pentapeptide repeat-containing protein n=1 Tax=Okeania sp. SIO2C9 TaxID=2607791 RepID=UPI0013C11179|nr:pentapeptide repeat-containing protein [Okeania sp. SIO2C9]NEQ72183.1 hypothetical protein [Okeania sp. SIO2C9]